MKRLTVSLLLCIAPVSLFAEAGRTAGTLLTRSLDARAAGLGQALTADSGQIADAFFNPAGVAQLDFSEISASYQNGLLDDNMGVINYGHATNNGAWFVNASALDAGKIDLHQSDGTSGSVRAEQDIAGSVGFAVGKKKPVAAGLSIKYLRSQLAETASANAVAGDAGLYWTTPVPGLRLAAAIQNVGTDLQYEVEKESLPRIERIGTSYLWDLENSVRTPDIFKCQYLFLLDGVKTKGDNSSFNAGFEIKKRMESDTIPGWAAVRAGYIEATKAVALGIGFDLWNVSLDYAINIVNDLDNTHRFTLGYRFAPQVKEREIPAPHNKAADW